MGETSSCCLAAVSLASRIVASCPLAVFRCQAMEFGLFGMLTRMWEAANVKVSGGSTGADLRPLTGPRTRSVCLSAIEMLVNHHDADVSSCCVKTLMPQVSQSISFLSEQTHYFLCNRSFLSIIYLSNSCSWNLCVYLYFMYGKAKIGNLNCHSIVVGPQLADEESKRPVDLVLLSNA